MTDRAINFTEIVDGVRADGGESTVTVTGDGPIDVCRQLYRELEERTDPTDCEFYVEPNRRRQLERSIVRDDVTIESEPFLERVIRTDVSMPADTVLFAHPDAVTIGGTVVGSRPVGLGEISTDE